MTWDLFVGEIATELLKQLITISRKSLMYKSAAESLHASISEFLPIIQEIKLSGVELSAFRQSQLDRFSETLREGRNLAAAALRSNRWNLYENCRLSRKMEKLDKKFRRFVQGPLQAHILADVHHMKFDLDERFERLQRSSERVEATLGELRIGSGDGGGGAARWAAMEEAMRMANEAESEAAGMEVASVGLGFGMRKVKEMLIGRDDLREVGISGIGGSGKTTLVKEICRDKEVLSYFDDRIMFLTISKSPNISLLRAKIWGYLMGNNDLNPNYTIPEFNLNLPFKHSKRTLVVLDDVWSLSDLENLIFPVCKTLVVSRIKFQTILSKSTHEMALLRDEEALSLFCFSAFGQRSVPPMADENLVNQIVRECKGLPLALKVIGASLRDEPEICWKSAKKKLARGETIGDSHESHLSERMAFSVNCLSEKHRDCFLDLGAFPEDEKIPLNVIVNIWAELHHIDAEEAFTIIFDLANKNLITLVKDSRYEDAYCSYYEISVTQHDVLRDLALHLNSRENVTERVRLLMPRRESEFPKEWEKNSDKPFNARMISIHTGEMNEMDWFKMDFPKAEVLILNFSSENYFLPPFMDNMPNLRAVVIVNHHSTNATLRNFLEFSSLANLRSLWLEKVTVPRLSESSVPLTRLQKLSLVLCKVNDCFDQSGRDLAQTIPSLSELMIDHCSDISELPQSISTVPRLRTLSITNCHKLRKLAPNLGLAKSLEILRLYACPELKELPNSLVELVRLKYLDVSQCVKLSKFPRGIDGLLRLEKIDMRDCSRLTKLPRFCGLSPWHLRRVVCDEEVSWLWEDAKRSLPNLNIEVAKKYYSLDWLNE